MNLRKVTSNRARGFDTSKKSTDCARNLTKVALLNETFFIVTKLLSVTYEKELEG